MAGRYQALNYQQLGHCVVVSLNATADDGAAMQLAAELTELCDRIAWDEETRVIVIAFGGELLHISSGDLAPHNSVERASMVEPVARLKQPVIAAIRGDATGVGLELALACDIRIGTEGACFGLPQVEEGLIPSNGGTQRLPRLVGQSKAIEMILTGELIDASEACRIGLLHRMVASDALMSTAMTLAQDMASKSPLSLSYAKEALHKGMDLTLDQGLRMELDLYLLLFSTSDRVEGITAFKEKRKPKFGGI